MVKSLGLEKFDVNEYANSLYHQHFILLTCFVPSSIVDLLENIFRTEQHLWELI